MKENGNNMINAIVAMDEKRGIGKNNDLLFRIPEDFDRMRKLTAGHPLVMGRKTFESIGRVLPGRTSVVITRDPDYLSPFQIPEKASVVVTATLEKGIEIAKTSPGSDEVFIFGGGEIFSKAIEEGYVERLYLTLVDGSFDADTFFPDYSQFKKVVSKEAHDNGEHKFTFVELEK